MQKTYHHQTGKFLATIAQSMPEISADVMQGWIENPKGLKKALAGALCPPKLSLSEGATISIPRNRFNPAEFLGPGWSIIADETDTRSATLTELDITNVQLVTMLRDGEFGIKGEEKLRRLKEANHVRLGADVLFHLLESKHLIPESWKEEVNGEIRFVFFDGMVLRHLGARYVLYLYWHDCAWKWDSRWLVLDWHDYYPSAVLAS